MRATVPARVASEGTLRLLADVRALCDADEVETSRTTALTRLEETLGRDFADRLVAALTAHPRH
jgi:hypothetical protein